MDSSPPAMRLLALLCLLIAAALPARAQQPADAFLSGLRALCGQAFEGRVIEAPASDTTFAGQRLVMHVRSCTDREVQIPLHVGEDRSRTWVVSRTAAGLRLKHFHRHADGTEDDLSQYGGDARSGFTAAHVEFPADAYTAELLPAAATNVWTLELEPGDHFTYALRREGTDRRYRLRFDLRRPVTPPPAPWGAAGFYPPY